MPIQDMSTIDHSTTPGTPARASIVMCALCGLRVGGPGSLDLAAEAVGITEIDPKSPTGPEVGPMDGIVDDDVPPVQAPLFGSFILLPGLPYNALGVLDYLVCTDCARGHFFGVIVGVIVLDEAVLDRKEDGEDAHRRQHGGRASGGTVRA